MKTVLFSILLSFLGQSNGFSSTIQVHQLQQISSLAYIHQDLLTLNKIKPRSNKYKLMRFDIEAGITAKGDVGVLTFAGGAAVEFIWKRNNSLGQYEANSLYENQYIYLPTNASSAEEIQKILKTRIKSFLKVRKFRKKFKRKFNRLIRRDSKKISKLIKNIVHMPRIGNWYIDRFFKSYSFSNNYSLGIIKFGGSKRIRFRFKIVGVPYLHHDTEKLNFTQQNLKKTMNILNDLGHNNSPLSQFSLYRARVIHDINKKFDIGIASIGSKSALTIEYRELSDDLYNFVPNISVQEKFETSEVSNINNFVIGQLDNVNFNNKKNSFKLREVRFKYSLDKSLGLKLATINKGSSFNLHYRNVQ
ncbi:hypothetical protein N9N67_09130 [Bacteriovoracaceae bacterium]|nr:hypothetical protein [Bacteriovoracaceae bacterium]